MKTPLILMISTILMVAITALYSPNKQSSAAETVVAAPELAGAMESGIAPWMITDMANDHPWGVICEELGYVFIDEADIPESDMSRQQMIDEIIEVWMLFFDDQKASPDDARRLEFEENAAWLADAIILYQNEETDIGGRLPKHPSTHYLLATMVTLESSVTRDIKMGSRGEVGMLQVFGRALAGYKPEEVQENPQLGIMLGVRWLAAHIPTCYPNGIGDEEWDSTMWLGPMSIYAAGERGKTKNGKCGKIRVARKRIDLANMYRPRVEYGLSQDEY